MSTFMNLQIDEEAELTKAPYIPMNMGDDLPLLLADDLMWNSNERAKGSPDSSSSLAQLLCSSLNKHSRSNEHGGGILHSDQIMDSFYNNKRNVSFGRFLSRLFD